MSAKGFETKRTNYFTESSIIPLRISRSVLSKALVALQKAGLTEVFHKPGQKSKIVVVDPQGTAAMAKREQRLKVVVNNDEREDEQLPEP